MPIINNPVNPGGGGTPDLPLLAGPNGNIEAKLSATVGTLTLDEGVSGTGYILVNVNNKASSVVLKGKCTQEFAITTHTGTLTLTDAALTFTSAGIITVQSVSAGASLTFKGDTPALNVYTSTGFTSIHSSTGAWPQGLDAHDTTNLATLDFAGFTAFTVSAGGPLWNLSGCALTAASQTNLLQLMATSGLAWVVNTSGGTTPAPTAPDLVNIGIIEGNGGTVTTN